MNRFFHLPLLRSRGRFFVTRRWKGNIRTVVINYRPTLIEGYLEASYPSSTTMLVMCVMPTAAMQLNARINNTIVRRCAIITNTSFTAFMVIGRLISGVHWITDIIGGALVSAGIVITYASVSDIHK